MNRNNRGCGYKFSNSFIPTLHTILKNWTVFEGMGSTNTHPSHKNGHIFELNACGKTAMDELMEILSSAYP